MGIDPDRYAAPAFKGEVAGIAINTSLALLNIHECLKAIQAGKPMNEESLTKIKECANTIGERFNMLSNWTDDEAAR